MTLVQRDLEILHTLTHRVRAVALKQAAELWWIGSKSSQSARKRLLLLVRQGWLKRQVINVHPLLDVSQPIMRWEPGDSEPDFFAIYKRNQNRWRVAATPLEVFTASPQAASLMGSTVHRFHLPTQISANLRLTSVYCHYVQQYAEPAQQWCLMENLETAYRGQQPMDACLRNQQGKILLGIVVVANVRAAQLERIHARYSNLETAYEIW